MKRRLRASSSVLRGALLIAGVANVAACAESTTVRSFPSGAKLYVNNEYVGTTPATVVIPRSKWSDAPSYRVELDGYEPAEGRFATTIGGGRVTGAVFTVGLSALFKRPSTFAQDEYVFNLSPSPISPGPETNQDSPERRLERVDALRRKGAITDQEHRRLRAEILDDL